MRKLISLIIILILSNLAYAHCGSCGVGGSKNHHKKEAISASTKQVEKAEIITEKYEVKFNKLMEKYENELSKVLDPANLKKHKKSYCSKCKKMSKCNKCKMQKSKYTKCENQKKCSNCNQPKPKAKCSKCENFKIEINQTNEESQQL
jgi:hypothetical protein